MRHFALVVAFLTAAAGKCAAGEIGFIEDFALAGDRGAAIKQLIPGTEDYYYYKCLHHEHAGRLDKIGPVLKLWIERHGRTSRVREIENRLALLTYRKDPKGTLRHLRRRLNLRFNHQREALEGAAASLPTRLDPKLIGRETLTARALRQNSGTTGGFEQSALDWLIATGLRGDRRRDLLRRLERPDHDGLPGLIVDDLRHRYSGGFGSLEIHKKLLRSQLDELVKLKPDLLNQGNFVNVYLTKLRPDADVDWRTDRKAKKRYLARLWTFVSRLSPAHNSLKAHVLYHRLALDRSMGVYSKNRFMAYLKLPRSAGYMRREYLNNRENRRYRANLNADFRMVTALPPVADDEPLIRDYLMRYFLKEGSYKPYARYVHDRYLKDVFAETKIVNGLGDMERWYSMLPPERYKALRERVDIDFAHTNKTLFGPEDPVALDVFVKNVGNLIVKVYEINTMNYYRSEKKELDTSINLDGLVANKESSHDYPDAPLRRVKRRFEFPSLKGRGVYVIDFVGNGKASRALIRKGRLTAVVRTGAAGQTFTVLDESNKKLKDATLWLGGREFTPEENGDIVVPFSASPGRQPVILAHRGFAWLDAFQQESEAYSLEAGIHVEREALLRRKTASVAVRPRLTVNGVPVSVTILESPGLTVLSTDRDGVASTKEVPDFKLYDDRASTFEFTVPENLASVQFILKAKVQVHSLDKKRDLSAARRFALNEIDRTEKIEDLHLSRVSGRYVLDLLGKTGEAKPDRAVRLELKHRDFRRSVHVSLRTNKRGRASLGTLRDIVWLRATGPEGTSHQWFMERDLRSMPAAVHGEAGEAVTIPYMGKAKTALRSAFSLLEVRDGTFVRDRFGALTVGGGFATLKGLPAGDYDLRLKESGENVRIRLTSGKRRGSHVLGRDRHLRTAALQPLQIASVSAGKGALRIRLKNATELSRVHVAAVRYMPEYPIFQDLNVSFPGLSELRPAKAESVYLAGRDIGDEYRYIIDRKYAKKFPGNMLKQPSLLLNPWAIRKTETGVKRAAGGAGFAGRGGGKGFSRSAPAASRPGRGAASLGGFANLDFLSESAAVLWNLRPDANGVVSIPRKKLGAHQDIRVVAVDPESTVYREISLREKAMPFNDLRLTAGLDVKKHFAERKQISVIRSKDTLRLADIASAKFEAYDTLSRVYALYSTLSNDPKLAEFRFTMSWPKLKPEEKREKYSKYACHELSFFLHKKDPEFFKAVIEPYLRNKKDKTFLDRWLLGDDLKGFLRPWAHARLNTVERILLARRLKGKHAATARHVKDLYDLIPPDVERFNHLFNTALRGSSLDTDDDLGVEKFRDQLRRKNKEERRRRRGRRPRPKGWGDALAQAAKRPSSMPAEPPPAPAEDMAAELDSIEIEESAMRRLVGGKKMLAKASALKDIMFNDARRRSQVRQFYRKLDKTEEWVENNYYKLPIEAQDGTLVKANAFWKDYAAHSGDGAFFSPNLAEASGNFTEMMLALAVLDLPFEAGKHASKFEGSSMSLSAGSPMVVYHREIKPAESSEKKTPILVSQNFFRLSDRYTQVDNERVEKYVTDEFLINAVYGCHVVVTNPTSARQKVDILLQVPDGAIPARGSLYTRGAHVDLQPYSTRRMEYYFYFPSPGTFAHYPVHVAKNEKIVGYAKPVTLKVVEKPSKVDVTSWDYVSQRASDKEVLRYLRTNNPHRVDLRRIAWRMRRPSFFNSVIPLLERAYVYNHTLWSYGVHHDAPAVIREYLRHSDGFIAQCGAYLDSPLLVIDPMERRAYQHMEYMPLVNARAHRLGRRRSILNDRFFEQYRRLMRVLSYRAKLDHDDLMAVTYYMLLQDRIEEAFGFFSRVDPKRPATRLQHDYFSAYLDLFTEARSRARALAERHADHPVDRWRKAFRAVLSQLDEIAGSGAAVVDDKDRGQKQTRLAATAPALDFKVEARRVSLSYQNLSEVRVNYYLMDIELLFSRNPFVKQYSGHFSHIRPNKTRVVRLDPGKDSLTFDLPEEYHSANVMVEITAAGIRKSQAYFANSLVPRIIESYGQLHVTREGSGEPIPKAYVKVYAEMRGGGVRFYRDGYTDPRGRFDYASLSTDEGDRVKKFSILVLSERDGATVQEADPPRR